MTWIKGAGGDLVNLDHIAFIDTLPIEQEDVEDQSHAVFARSTLVDDENQFIQVALHIGDEPSCERFKDALFAKLPKVQL